MKQNTLENEKGILLAALEHGELSPEVKAGIIKAADGREVLFTTDRDAIEQNLDRIEIIFDTVPWDMLHRMPLLRWVQVWSAGADRLLAYPELRGLPFILTNTSGMHADQITEHILGMMLAWNRCFVRAFAAQKRHEWFRPREHEISVLRGKTMLIAGYGSIGRQIAQAAVTFGMKVTGIRRRVPDTGMDGAVQVAAFSRLPELLAGADFVVNLLPLTEETRGVFGKDQFNGMKAAALYAGAGRGKTTDEEALIEALQTKRIAGALLDVTAEEPLPSDSPLWDMDNVIITGHYAGMHPDYHGIALGIALDNLGRYVRGEAMLNVVDKEAGY
ncbi:MAG: D-2-hydroxyacid dehydrogenase [Treponema sp.]|jgi:phosphoglycerate dehydrogenase-like enzyme|nr:D-2-hydroxyacid dehydrogenase [Treponema sp.]